MAELRSRGGESGPRLGPLLIAVFLFCGASTARGQDEEATREPGWSGTSEVSLVSSGGNAEATTFGLKGRLNRIWTRGTLVFKLSGLRAESTEVTRSARGTVDDFRIDEVETETTSAENYSTELSYRRDFSPQLSWFATSGWERNEFAGVRNRYVLSAGIGHDWWETGNGHLKTGYGASVTRQQDVVSDPDRSDTFVGLRLSLDLSRALTASTTFDTVLVVDQSVDESRDFRFDHLTSLAVSMTERLAFKVSLQLLFDNDPALVAVPLIDDRGEPTGATVFTRAERLDTLLNVALVVDL